MDEFICKDNNKNRQTLKKYYRINGCIYMINTKYFFEYKNFYHNNSFAYVMDKASSIDVDDLLDFKFASFLVADKES
ncbi:hypothetical protein SDC9_173311 [bioreactor metagenome]|uniref:Uncharacterized protein n=1 Tax=bioreactor metagenome TaxID=1076179 RepID=A0A645GQE6_9ZZZZ